MCHYKHTCGLPSLMLLDIRLEVYEFTHHGVTWIGRFKDGVTIVGSWKSCAISSLISVRFIHNSCDGKPHLGNFALHAYYADLPTTRVKTVALPHSSAPKSPLVASKPSTCHGSYSIKTFSSACSLIQRTQTGFLLHHLKPFSPRSLSVASSHYGFSTDHPSSVLHRPPKAVSNCTAPSVSSTPFHGVADASTSRRMAHFLANSAMHDATPAAHVTHVSRQLSTLIGTTNPIYTYCFRQRQSFNAIMTIAWGLHETQPDWKSRCKTMEVFDDHLCPNYFNQSHGVYQQKALLQLATRPWYKFGMTLVIYW